MYDLNRLQGGFVPTGHNLTNVLNLFLQYKDEGGAPTRQGYIEWRVGQGAAPGAAAAEWYPLGDTQCGFGQLPLADVIAITRESESFRASTLLRALVPVDISNAVPTVKSAFVVGALRARNMANDAIKDQCVERGWAGTQNAAQAILSVGQSFLNHFALVDEEGLPNGRFALLFG